MGEFETRFHGRVLNESSICCRCFASYCARCVYAYKCDEWSGKCFCEPWASGQFCDRGTPPKLTTYNDEYDDEYGDEYDDEYDDEDFD